MLGDGDDFHTVLGTRASSTLKPNLCGAFICIDRKQTYKNVASLVPGEMFKTCSEQESIRELDTAGDRREPASPCLFTMPHRQPRMVKFFSVQVCKC